MEHNIEILALTPRLMGQFFRYDPLESMKLDSASWNFRRQCLHLLSLQILILQSLVEIVELGDGEIVSWTIWASNNSHLLDKNNERKQQILLDPQQGISLCGAATRWNGIVTRMIRLGWMFKAGLALTRG